MFTICLALAVLPEPSVAVQVTIVLPSRKSAGALLVTDLIIPLSVTVALPSGTTLSVVEEASKTTSFGGVICGGVVSIRFTICLALAVLPEPSVAVQVTVVLPSRKSAGALLVTDLIIPLSVTVALPSGTTLLVALVASCIISDGA